MHTVTRMNSLCGPPLRLPDWLNAQTECTETDAAILRIEEERTILQNALFGNPRTGIKEKQIVTTETDCLSGGNPFTAATTTHSPSEGNPTGTTGSLADSNPATTPATDSPSGKNQASTTAKTITSEEKNIIDSMKDDQQTLEVLQFFSQEGISTSPMRGRSFELPDELKKMQAENFEAHTPDNKRKRLDEDGLASSYFTLSEHAALKKARKDAKTPLELRKRFVELASSESNNPLSSWRTPDALETRWQAVCNLSKSQIQHSFEAFLDTRVESIDEPDEIHIREVFEVDETGGTDGSDEDEGVKYIIVSDSESGSLPDSSSEPRESDVDTPSLNDLPGSDDWCYLCDDTSENRTLICCDRCPRVCHPECVFGSYEVPDPGESWVCPHCEEEELHLIDDSELTAEEVHSTKEIFKSIRQTLKKKNPETDAPRADVQNAIAEVIHRRDDNYEQMTKEIEGKNGFKTTTLADAEKQVLKAFSKEQDDQLRARVLSRMVQKNQQQRGAGVANQLAQPNDTTPTGPLGSSLSSATTHLLKRVEPDTTLSSKISGGEMQVEQGGDKGKASSPSPIPRVSNHIKETQAAIRVSDTSQQFSTSKHQGVHDVKRGSSTSPNVSAVGINGNGNDEEAQGTSVLGEVSLARPSVPYVPLKGRSGPATEIPQRLATAIDQNSTAQPNNHTGQTVPSAVVEAVRETNTTAEGQDETMGSSSSFQDQLELSKSNFGVLANVPSFAQSTHEKKKPSPNPATVSESIQGSNYSQSGHHVARGVNSGHANNLMIDLTDECDDQSVDQRSRGQATSDSASGIQHRQFANSSFGSQVGSLQRVDSEVVNQPQGQNEITQYRIHPMEQPEFEEICRGLDTNLNEDWVCVVKTNLALKSTTADFNFLFILHFRVLKVIHPFHVVVPTTLSNANSLQMRRDLCETMSKQMQLMLRCLSLNLGPLFEALKLYRSTKNIAHWTEVTLLLGECLGNIKIPAADFHPGLSIIERVQHLGDLLKFAKRSVFNSSNAVTPNYPMYSAAIESIFSNEQNREKFVASTGKSMRRAVSRLALQMNQTQQGVIVRR